MSSIILENAYSRADNIKQIWPISDQLTSQIKKIYKQCYIQLVTRLCKGANLIFVPMFMIQQGFTTIILFYKIIISTLGVIGKNCNKKKNKQEFHKQ